MPEAAPLRVENSNMHMEMDASSTSSSSSSSYSSSLTLSSSSSSNVATNDCLVREASLSDLARAARRCRSRSQPCLPLRVGSWNSRGLLGGDGLHNAQSRQFTRKALVYVAQHADIFLLQETHHMEEQLFVLNAMLNASEGCE